MPKLIVKPRRLHREIDSCRASSLWPKPGERLSLNHPAISELHCEIIVENSLYSSGIGRDHGT